MMWTTRSDNELYVWWNGELVYKKWLNYAAKPSIINDKWPNVRIR